MASPREWLRRKRRELEELREGGLRGAAPPGPSWPGRSSVWEEPWHALERQIRRFRVLNPEEALGRRIETLPLEIRQELPDWRQWYVVAPAAARRLRPDANTRFFIRERAGWRVLQRPESVVGRTQWLAVRRMRVPQDTDSGTAGAPADAMPATVGEAAFYPLNENTNRAEGEFRVRLRGYQGAEPRRLMLTSQCRSIQRNIDADGDRSVRFGGLQAGELYSLRVSGNGLASQYLFRDVPPETLRQGGDALRSHLRDNGIDATAHVLDHDTDARDTVTLTLAVDPPQFGAFFDGTGNNLYNDVNRDDRAPTNVGKLYELHRHVERPAFDQEYSVGVGADSDGLRDLADRATASSFGWRIQEVVREFVSFSSGYPLALSVVIDVFGFSRGAAQARAFINQIVHLHRDDPDHFGGPTPVIRFAGLFDTVGSIGIPGNGSNDNFWARRGLDAPIELGLDPDTVEHVLHLTAACEKRANFPLSPLGTTADAPLPDHFEERALPGAHADIGGGYPDAPDVVHFPPLRLRNVTRDEQQRLAERHVESLYQRYDTPGLELSAHSRRTTTTDPYSAAEVWTTYVTWERDIDPSLAHYPLEIMHAAATEVGVPLKPLSRLGDMGYKYVVSDDLRELVEAVEREGRTGDAYDALYTRYIHHSHQYSAPHNGDGAGVGMEDWFNTNRPEANADEPESDSVRAVFYPDPPAHAVDPEPPAAEPVIWP